MNQALAMSVAFTAATSGLLNDAVKLRQNCSNAPTKRSSQQASTSLIENIQNSLLGSNQSAITRARSFEEVAQFYRMQEQPEAAMQLYRYAIDLREHIHGEDDPQLVADLRTASELAEETGDTKEASELLQQAIDTCKNHASARL